MTDPLVTMALQQIHRELAEIRDSIIDLDHAKARSSLLSELWTRVDELAAALVHDKARP